MTILQLTTEEHLQRALNILRKHGWTRAKYRNEDGEYCMVGAMRAATRDPLHGCYEDLRDRIAAVMERDKVIADVIREYYPDAALQVECSVNTEDANDNILVMYWNDNWAADQTEVEQVLEKAIARAGEYG